MSAIERETLTASATTPAGPGVGGAVATRLLAGVVVPDTPSIARAIEYARRSSEPYLFNHVMRSWLFAVRLAELKRTEHDMEVLAVATLLHDLGLEKAFSGPLRFEVEGANAARKFARLRRVFNAWRTRRPGCRAQGFS